MTQTAARVWLAVLFVASVALYVFPCWWGIPADNFGWAYDEIMPKGVLHPDLWTPVYPPAHRHLLAGVFALIDPFIEGRSLSGELQPNDIRLLTARLVSVTMAGLTLLLLYRTTRILSDRLTALLAVASFGFGLTYVFYAKTANLEVPYLFWFALSLYFFVRCFETRHWASYVLFAVAGALAITTKTQAAGLYLLPPLALVHDLRTDDAGRRRTFWRALLDRRIVEAAGACLAVGLLVFRRGELTAHIETIRSFEHFDPGGAGLGSFASSSLDNLAFVTGLPVLLAAAVGIAASLLGWLRGVHRTRLLQLLLFVVPYYLIFVARTGFNYDRHYLPIAYVLSFFAAGALAQLLSTPRKLRPLGWAAVVLVVAVGLLRSLSVDLLLHGDARYEAEKWMENLNRERRVVGLGNRQVLPRNLTTVQMKRFARWRRGEHGHNPMVWHNCTVLDELDADLLVTTEPELLRPGVNYRELRRFRNRSPLRLVDFSNDQASNISKIARDVIVYERVGEECVDAGWLPHALNSLRFDRDHTRRQVVAEAILRSPGISARRLTWSDLQAVRLDAEFWTRGTQPAGIVLENTWFEPVTPRLQLTVPPLAAADFPATVFIDDGTTTREVVFERNARKAAELAPVDGEKTRLYIIWTDKVFTTPEGRLRGVRILPDGEPDDPFQRVAAALATLSRGSSEHIRASFIRSVLNGAAGETVPLGDDVFMVAAWWDGWTYGTAHAGLVIHNRESKPIRPRVRVLCDSLSTEPVRLTIEDGVETRRYALDCSKPRSIKLARVKPGSRRLFILQSDHASLPLTDSEKLRGVRVKEVLLDPKEARNQPFDEELEPGIGSAGDEDVGADSSVEGQ